MKHLLVTNDFPPKLGGIQTYLWELWRRLPPEETTVLTTPHEGAEAWDRAQPFRVVRSRQRVLLPTPAVRAQVDALADEVGAELVRPPAPDATHGGEDRTLVGPVDGEHDGAAFRQGENPGDQAAFFGAGSVAVQAD